MSHRFTIIRITVIFILGIVIKDFYNITISDEFIIKYLIFYLLFLFIYPKKYSSCILNGIIVFVFIFLLGIYLKTLNDNDYEKNNNLEDTREYYCISLETKILDHEYDKCIFLLKAVKIGEKLEEVNDFIKIQVFFKDTDELNRYKINCGDIFLISGSLQPIKQSQKNLGLKKYLQEKYIFFNDYIYTFNCKFIKNNPYNRLFAFIENSKLFLQQKLIQNIQEDDNIRGIISALILGDKSKLTPYIKQVYQKINLSHILAISGLHIVLVFKIIMFILSLFLQSARFMFLKKLITIFFILFYAAITGSNPPVLRATITIILITLSKNYFQNIIILADSALLLIALSPSILFSASFQMSCVCVLSISLFYRKFYNVYEIKKFYTSFVQRIKVYICIIIRDVLIITLTAKIMITPLVIYYFHYFTGFNFLPNLIIIIFFTTTIIFLSIFIMFFSTFSPIFSNILSILVETMNDIAIFFSKIQIFYVDNIIWNKIDVLFYYLIFAFLYKASESKKSIYFWIAIIIGYVWLAKVFNDDFKVNNQRNELCEKNK